ncbi:Hemoprotein HemQ, essential component of heme biosynthetic pathway in Gram-positive bacteria [Corynebacterium glutamicum]|uniref:hydrogen peroxide-dependent heme synthase n=1 Tax=Corynebacterium glutamicum TaxID=1718 RepID=UPI00097A3134|nr:hydrogen peroxide-dependent heme synthase [Corynebacterium glutamicum]GAV97426.1 chlorite dismutase [Corynebacterium glutamicum]SJM49417.1 Hemoprotein HemQ, essential component of heme biosynthetic pathway in Gram-positive bacteria [Corynebacterium glutamicum]HJE10062.1 chlorite dismutase family protein [Corynebacterium glutamicum]
MSELDIKQLNKLQRYSQWAVFRAIPGALDDDRTEVTEQAAKFFADLESEGKVTVRGIYNASGLRADADYMIWWHAEEFEDIQKAFADFRRTTILGQVSEVFWIGNALHRPSEFNKAHLPSFIMGEEAKDWITVYPFVRSYDWYIMEPLKRSRILREHGQAAVEFPDVRANTVPAFALGDYEWVLAFEADELHRIVDLMHKMRYTEARLHVREELPFISGQRVDIADLIKVLP